MRTFKCSGVRTGKITALLLWAPNKTNVPRTCLVARPGHPSLEEDTSCTVAHSLSGAAHRAWSVCVWAMSMAEYDTNGNDISKSQYWHRGPGVQASLAQGYPQHKGRNSSLSGDQERSHGVCSVEGPLKPWQPPPALGHRLRHMQQG